MSPNKFEGGRVEFPASYFGGGSVYIHTEVRGNYGYVMTPQGVMWDLPKGPIKSELSKVLDKAIQ